VPVVVIGATGLVGSGAVEAFVRSSPQVRAYIRRADAAEALRAKGAKVAVGTLDDVARLAAVMAGAHTVCHLAGGLEPPPGVSYSEHVLGTVEPVIDAARRVGIRRFLYLSYPGASVDAAHPYLRAKGEAERLLAEGPFDSIVVRSTHIYGAGGTWVEALRAQADRRPRVVVGSGRQVLAPVLVDDVVAVLVAADDRARAPAGVWGLEGPTRVTADALADALAGTRRLAIHLSPARAARLSRLGGRPTRREALEILAMDCLRDAPDAAEEFGVRTTPLAEGLARTFAGQPSGTPE
jgi:uncharacterized protein YbjT (DUF2867 family)